MSTFKRLIHEVHRRSLWQVLGLYVVGSWVALQVVETLSETVGLPEWFGPAAFGLLIVGLPIVVATAFVQEGAGGGGAGRSMRPGEGEKVTVDGADRAIPGRSTPPPAGGADPAGTAVPTGAGDPTGVDPYPGTRHRLFTWRNATLGGVGAFALLGLVTAGWMAMRTLGIGPAGTLVAKGLIEEGERVMLADFDNLTPDSLLGEVVTEAFRVDLAQTPVVSLVEPAYVADVLARMERPADARLDEVLAREIAIREGIKAVITGEIGTAGGAYVLSARVLSAGAGEELESLRETASDSTRIVSAIDDLSEQLRERLGESLRSVRGGEPLERVTTGSLEALRKYSQALTAINRGEGDKGEALLEEAVEIDSTFAMAWRKLATRVDGERQVEAATRAYELRDRLTERERYHTIALYHYYVMRDFERSATANRTLLDSHPNDGLALNNLGVSYNWMGDRERALDAWTRSRDAGYAGASAHTRIIRANYELGRLDEARAALARFAEERADHPAVAREEWEMALLDGDLETARAAASRLLDHEVTGWSDAGRRYLATLEASRGRVQAAREHIESQRGVSELERALGMAWQLDLYVLGDTARAKRRVAAALQRASAEDLELEDRAFLVRLFARTGQASAARPLLDRIEAELDSAAAYFPWAPLSRIARGEILTAEGRYMEALEQFRAYERERGPICYGHCNVDEQARAWDQAGRRDSAIVYYERYVEPEWQGRVFSMHHLPPIHERLGQLYDEAGDLESAAQHYARFVELWAEADPELRPRVEAAQARLEEIVAERG